MRPDALPDGGRRRRRRPGARPGGVPVRLLRGRARRPSTTSWPTAAEARCAIAERPFVAALPQRLLSHPSGGALAVIGHVERAWGYSIQPPGSGPQLVPFRNLLGRVLRGRAGGPRDEGLQREVRRALGRAARAAGRDPARPPARATRTWRWTWVERNDAQNYVVLGDPAVRLRVDQLQ